MSPYAACRFSRRWSFLGLLIGGDCEPGGTFVYRSHAKYATHDNPPLIAANDSAARPQSSISCLPFSVRSQTGLKNETKHVIGNLTTGSKKGAAPGGLRSVRVIKEIGEAAGTVTVVGLAENSQSG